MTKQEFQELCSKRIVILDGATGSNLQKRGMPTGVCPELWISEHPEVLQGLQREYIEAGSDIVYAPTFSGNRIKMAEYGLADRLEEINAKLVRIAKEGAAGKALVAGDITMTGAQLEPLGDLSFAELIEVYKEQLHILAEAGVDLIVVETMMSLQETRAAVIAAKEVCPDLPVMATLSFTESGKTLYGASADAAVTVLQSMGVDAVGMNCSAGPDKMVKVLDMMTPYAKIPLITKPNAGLPKLAEDGVTTTYDMNEDDFGVHMKALAEHGAGILGGCCGTTPAFIANVKGVADTFMTENGVSGKEISPNTAQDQILLATERQVFAFTEGQKLELSDGIDFSKEEDVRDEFADDEYDTAVDLAFDLFDDEADAILIRADVEGIDEAQALIGTANAVTQMVQLPVIFAVSNASAAKEVLRSFSGLAGIMCLAEAEDEKNAVLNTAKWYGAVMVTIDKEIRSC